MSRIKRPAAVCPCTGLSIPECSCRRCLEEQMRTFSPLLRPGGLRSLPQRPAPPPADERRWAA